ncbi:PfaB family protein [Shewanella psychropiezotolerans]|uniref:PfaB family protein n=1 Tax=Shewanella psychropiezotolerans TaxID=2593655 RepID=A0ABX5X1E9_9GAMM|nr:PfaB family protein [Shewanella psychropiezotolerans]QDO85164.1 PfaB family protein [Shewanella psychropiezotolerans]
MNPTLNAQQQQAPQKVAMPLRIALLVLPSTRLSCDSLSANPLEVLLPELYQSGLLSSKEGVSQKEALEQIVNIEVDDFEANLKASIQAIDEGKLVQLSTPSQSLLMMPALKAAQLRIHPHAQLAAIQQGNDGVQQTMALALAQAKRDSATVSKIENLHDLNSQQKFTAVHQLITELASRTRFRDEVNQGVTLGPKQAKSHYWFTQNHQARVTAVNFSHSVNNISAGKQINTSFIITQGTGFIAPKSIVDSQRLQLVLSGDTQTELLTALNRLKAELLAEPNSDSVLTVMRDNLIAFEQTNTRYAVTLQASSVDAMQLELNAMIEALPAVMAEDGLHSYKTPAGSYFTSEPLGNVEKAGLAFVYPGVGTVYADMFSELHRYFPTLYSRLEREGDLKSMLQADAIYHLDAKVAPAMPLGDLAIAGVGSSYLLTQLLMQEFNITPNFALGYSMGEASMWASLGVWDNPHDLISKTQTDPLFTTAISGQLTAVRQAWKLNNTDSDIVWNSFVVRSPSEPIKALLPEFPRAYLAIIQGDTCVIAGCEIQCRELLSKLKKRGIAANRVTAMHTTPAMEEHGNVIEFYTQPLCEELPQDIKFISAASLSGDRRDKAVNEAGAIDSNMIAQSIADTFCNTLDFTSLIHSAQRQGAKLFVELGADRQNSTLIDKIAKLDRSCGAEASSYPCCTVPVNAKGGDDITSLLKALGQLISHRVPLSLQPLIDGLNREIAIRELNSAGLTNHNGIVSGEPDAHKLLKGEV